MIFAPVVAFILALSSVSDGQVVFKHANLLRTESLDRINSEKNLFSITELIPKHSLPQLDNDLLIAEEQAREMHAFQQNDGLLTGPYNFGKLVPVEYDLADGLWLDGGRAWFMEIQSDSAHSLSVRFDDFRLPVGAELYISNPVTGHVRGPFTADNNKQSGVFAIFPIEGNVLRLEYYTTLNSDPPTFRVTSVVHGYRQLTSDSNTLFNTGRSGKCNINVACKEAKHWRNQVKSVAMILTNSGTGYCTGAMLNNGARDGRQLFLTAYHCVGGKNVSDNLLMFNFETEKCNSTARANRSHTALGLKHIAEWYTSDYSLLELEERIPDSYNVYLSGWSADEERIPAFPVGIHHPSADVKKISLFNGNCTSSSWGLGFGSPNSLRNDHWRVSSWSRGTTEPGSSGSPLFDGLTKRVVGQLHGGSAACHNPEGYDMYGKLATSFHKSPSAQKLQSALDPTGTGLTGMDGEYLTALSYKTGINGDKSQHVFRV